MAKVTRSQQNQTESLSPQKNKVKNSLGVHKLYWKYYIVVCKRGLFIQELGQRPLVRLVEPVDAANCGGFHPSSIPLRCSSSEVGLHLLIDASSKYCLFSEVLKPRERLRCQCSSCTFSNEEQIGGTLDTLGGAHLLLLCYSSVAHSLLIFCARMPKERSNQRGSRSNRARSRSNQARSRREEEGSLVHRGRHVDTPISVTREERWRASRM